MPPRPLHRLLITGAAGALGQELRRRLAGFAPATRLSDMAPMAPAAPGEEVVRCDLADADGVAALCQGVDAIVHLGGIAREADWPTIHAANVLGAINLWEGARRAGVGRIVFASSNHAIGLYRRSQRLDHTAEPRPDSRYGLSKAFGEDLARLYAYKHGIAAFCMRIGSAFAEPLTARMLSTWHSPDDFERLVRVGLTAAYVFEIVYGVSRNTRGWWDNSNAERLGYAPHDDAERFAARFAGDKTTNRLDDEFQGGPFVSPEFTADPERIP